MSDYRDNYKIRYEEYLRKKREERQMKLNQDYPKPQIIPQASQPVIEKIEQEVKEAKEFITEPRHFKIFKLIIILIPIIILLFLLYTNFISSQYFNYFYDIGGEIDSKTSYLSPLTRISESLNSYRNLTSDLVYFNVPIPRNSQSLKIQLRFKNNLPENSIMRIGAKDQEVWHYSYNPLYIPYLNLEEFNKQGNIYLINKNFSFSDINSSNIVIATDKKRTPEPNRINFTNSQTLISSSLRGGHTFYVYTAGNLNLKIKKQDINWYNGSDELYVNLYDYKNNLLANITIPDDGISGVNHNQAIMQEASLNALLEEGVYRIEFTNFDGLIREINLNTDKIVIANTLYLADNSLFNLETKPSTLYFQTLKPSELALYTYHAQGFQEILINSRKLSINKTHNATLYNISGEYLINVPVNDLILSYPGYFAFNKANYFEPFRQRIIPIKDTEYIKANADFLITDYSSPMYDNGWLIGQADFNLKDLYIKDNKLSLLINNPHFGNELYENYTIPIDWINITIYKKGLI